ncbi:MAG: hypothetical protein VX730_01340 [Pseudomonadota bacterium]|nr:hypothetical protein [Pseudomonadota bacterium]
MKTYLQFLNESSFKDQVSIGSQVYRNLAFCNVMHMLFLAFAMSVCVVAAYFAPGFVSGVVSGVLITLTHDHVDLGWTLSGLQTTILAIIFSSYFIYRFAIAVLGSIRFLYFRFKNFNIKRPGLLTLLYYGSILFVSGVVGGMVYWESDAFEYTESIYLLLVIMLALSVFYAVVAVVTNFKPLRVLNKEDELLPEEFKFSGAVLVFGVILAVIVVISSLLDVANIAQEIRDFHIEIGGYSDD